MRMVFFKVPFYLLCIFALNQAHYASEGSRWMNLPLKDLQAAAEARDSYAQGFLALVYAHGDKGADISISNASKWAALSSQANHWLGHFALGFLARFRADGLEETDVGRYYLKSFRDRDGRMIKAAASGDPIASYALAEIFTSDEVRPSLEPDLELAAEHYSIASRAGYGPASVEFALIKAHVVGNDEFGIKKDLPGGIALLQEAAQADMPSANHYLGRFYYQGIGVDADPKMALVHYQAAADRGHAISQLTVADFHAYGEAGPVKIDLALRYARLAMDQMETQALQKISAYEELLAGGSTAQSDQLALRLRFLLPSEAFRLRLLRLVQQESNPAPASLSLPCLLPTRHRFEPPSLRHPFTRRRHLLHPFLPLHLLCRHRPTQHRSQTRIRKGNWPRSIILGGKRFLITINRFVCLPSPPMPATRKRQDTWESCIFAGRAFRRTTPRLFNGLLLLRNGVIPWQRRMRTC